MTHTNKKRVLFVTGSTGGHVWPAVWIAKQLQLQSSDIECYFYISGSIIEEKILKAQSFQYTRVYSGKWRRYFSLLNFIDIFKIILGFFQSMVLLIISRPKIIFIKGGFLGVPIAFAAIILSIPYVNHESDARLGLANKVISRFSNRIFVAFPADLYHMSPTNLIKTQTVGIPIAPEFYNLKKPETKISTILFLGGSLGSKKINDSLKPILEKLLTKYKIIHICGQNNLQEFQNVKSSLIPQLRNNYDLYGFIEYGIADLMKSSNLVVSRAGATTIFELASLAKPVIFIPLGRKASRGDQIYNCKFIQELHAGIVINDDNLSTNKLQQKIIELVGDPNQVQKISTNIRSISVGQSSQTIVNYLKKYL
ncbi:MAG: UDP-N-acetylglucosamine--N-acetylmuramyl-(pentapeptide) pyrophosphoryl-undecaprenol N-acetylglucosamine transferase [bacterium]